MLALSKESIRRIALAARLIGVTSVKHESTCKHDKQPVHPFPAYCSCGEERRYLEREIDYLIIHEVK